MNLIFFFLISEFDLRNLTTVSNLASLNGIGMVVFHLFSWAPRQATCGLWKNKGIKPVIKELQLSITSTYVHFVIWIEKQIVAQRELIA